MMRVPTWIRCLWLRFLLREERSRLAELLGQESIAQVDYARCEWLEVKAAAAQVVAEWNLRIARSRGRIGDLRRRLARLDAGLPERGGARS